MQDLKYFIDPATNRDALNRLILSKRIGNFEDQSRFVKKTFKYSYNNRMNRSNNPLNCFDV
jgi:hypothetical protein